MNHEIAVRVVRACREMGLQTVALYQPVDIGSLHVRLADECVCLDSPAGFLDGDAILQIAQTTGADAIHPGYGFLAERPDFIDACTRQGIAFIGPPAHVVAQLQDKVAALNRAREAGFPVVAHSTTSFAAEEWPALQAAAEQMGYPLMVKPCSGGRGPAGRLVRSPEHLAEAVRATQAQAQAVYGEQRVYLEQAILPARQVGVQVLGDRLGQRMHLGEREGSLIFGRQKVVEEAPSPALNQQQRQQLWSLALDLAGLFELENLATVEFLLDQDGRFFFSEIKARIQVEHPLTEMLTGVDLVQTQIALAAGEPLSTALLEMEAPTGDQGWAMLCRVRAEDPWRGYMASPGRVHQVRFPDGPGVRVDSYLYCGVDIPAVYDPLIAKLTVWGQDREQCLARLSYALEDFIITGAVNNVPRLQEIVNSADFAAGHYDSNFPTHSLNGREYPPTYYQDLAIMAAVLYQQRLAAIDSEPPVRLRSGWHRSSRQLAG